METLKKAIPVFPQRRDITKLIAKNDDLELTNAQLRHAIERLELQNDALTRAHRGLKEASNIGIPKALPLFKRGLRYSASHLAAAAIWLVLLFVSPLAR